MRFSKFCHIYEICDSRNNFYYLIRHSILNYSYFFKSDEFSELERKMRKNEKNKILDILIANHLIVPEDYSEKELASYVWRNVKKPKVNLDNPKTPIQIFFTRNIRIATQKSSTLPDPLEIT